MAFRKVPCVAACGFGCGLSLKALMLMRGNGKNMLDICSQVVEDRLG